MIVVVSMFLALGADGGDELVAVREVEVSRMHSAVPDAAKKAVRSWTGPSPVPLNLVAGKAISRRQTRVAEADAAALRGHGG